MMFVATLTHPPELCLAREEFGEVATQWVNGMNDVAKNLGIKVYGAYSCPTEHTFYLVVESADLKAATAFFSELMSTDNAGKISPVIPLKAAADILSQ